MFLLLILLLTGCLVGCTTIEQTRTQMGTTVTIKAVGNADNAVNAADAAFSEIGRVEALLSNYINTSEVFKLNKNKKIDNPSSDFLIVLKKSEFYNQVSQGGFDPTVQPLLDLYSRTYREEQRPPTDCEIKDTKDLVNFNNVIVSEFEVTLEENMSITLGGIAKGYAIDRAVAVLKSKGIEDGFVNAGGDIRAYGSNGNPWTIVLQNPRDETDYISLIKAENVAVATSGDYERYYDPSFEAHHIMDPRTGKSATDLISVTVISKTAVDADALATSVFVMGTSGLDLIESLDNTEALIITKDREILRSSGFSKYEI